MYLQTFIGTLLGLIIGSFLAVILIRLPQGKQIIYGRSRCDTCGHIIPIYLIIPVISFIILGGKCNKCRAKIPKVHFVIEVATAITGGVFFNLLPWLEAVIWCIFIWQIILLIMLDTRHYWLPDILNILLAISGLTLLSFMPNSIVLIDRLAGGLTGFFLLYSISYLYSFFRKKEGMGAGDPKMLGAIGCWLGWQVIPYILLLSAILGLGIALLMQLIGHNIKADTRLPLGSLMGASSLIILSGQFIN